MSTELAAPSGPAIVVFCGVLAAAVLANAAQPRDASESPAPKHRQPNILLIVADDLGFNDLGAYGNPAAQTPRLDALAAAGTRFTRFYTAGNVCSPTRASLLTGLYPERLGFNAVPRGLPDEVVTLPDLLRTAGYSTHHIGKWHLGEDPPSVRPLGQGFDTFFGFLNQWRLSRQGFPTYLNPWLVNGDSDPVAVKGHLTDLLTEQAIQTIRSGRKQQPWFVNLWYYAPHTPIQPPPRWATKFPSDPDGQYRALVAALDEGVGRVLEELERTDQASRTLVVFLSDNGAPTARHNLPFFGAKTRVFEGGLRVPMIVRAPDRAGPRVNDDAVISIDILPTLASMAGVEVHDSVDGVDLTPLLADPGGSIPERLLFWEGSSFVMASAQNLEPEPTVPASEPAPDGSAYSVLSADGRWRLSVHRNIALFDLATDPTGRVNALQNQRGVAATLESDYRAWARQIHRVPVRAVPQGAARWDGHQGAFSGEGRVDLVGYDVLRAPGVGGWTFSVGVRPKGFPGVAQVIASQAGVWSLESDSAGHLILRMGKSVLTTDAVLAAGKCAGVAVMFRRGFVVSGPQPAGKISLVVSGRTVARGAATIEMPSDALARPTAVGNSEEGGRGFVGALRDPSILSVGLTPAAASDLTLALCAANENAEQAP